jgi:hypothetical protein
MVDSDTYSFSSGKVHRVRLSLKPRDPLSVLCLTLLPLRILSSLPSWMANSPPFLDVKVFLEKQEITVSNSHPLPHYNERLSFDGFLKYVLRRRTSSLMGRKGAKGTLHTKQHCTHGLPADRPDPFLDFSAFNLLALMTFDCSLSVFYTHIPPGELI